MDDQSQEELLADNKCFQELELQKSYEYEKIHQEPIAIHDVGDVIDTMVMMDFAQLGTSSRKVIRDLQHEINSSQVGWVKLDLLNDIVILTALFYDWLENLKKPVLDRDNLETIVVHYKHTESCFSKLEMDASYLIEYILIFISKLHTSSKMHTELVKRVLAALTQQYVILRDTPVPASRGFRKLREGTTACAMEFLVDLLALVELHHRQKTLSHIDINGEQFKSDDDSDVETGFHN